MFEHQFLPKLQLKQINSDNGRRYETPDNKTYKSVTTWLGELDHSSLDEWKKAVGEETANRIASRAANRGTILHQNIEQYLLNEEVRISATDILNKSMFNGIKPVLSRINNIRLLESPLYSHSLKLAGTVDCVAEFDGVLSVIDFKSSTNVKDKESITNYWLQCCIYSLMVEERYGLKINRLVVLIGNEFSKPSVFIDEKKNWAALLRKKILESNHLRSQK